MQASGGGRERTCPLLTFTRVIDKLNKKHQVTEVDVIFSGPVNSAEADSIAGYRLATPGKKGSYTAKNAGIIKLKRAFYTASTNTVALTPKKPFALTKPVQVLVYGMGSNALQDAEGRDIDGDDNGDTRRQFRRDHRQEGRDGRCGNRSTDQHEFRRDSGDRCIARRGRASGIGAGSACPTRGASSRALNRLAKRREGPT